MCAAQVWGAIIILPVSRPLNTCIKNGHGGNGWLRYLDFMSGQQLVTLQRWTSFSMQEWLSCKRKAFMLRVWIVNNMPLFSLENPCACSCHKCKYLHTSPRLQLNMYKMTKACNHKLHNQQARACTAASGSGPPVFIDDVLLIEAAGWTVKCIEQYSQLIFREMLQNWSDSVSRCKWTMIQSVPQKQPENFSRQRRDILHWPSQSFYLQIAHVFELPKTKLNAERHPNKQ